MDLETYAIEIEKKDAEIAKLKAEIKRINKQTDLIIKASCATSETTLDTLLKVCEQRDILKDSSERLREQLQLAINGLQWRIDTHPEQVNECDFEQIKEWQSILKETEMRNTWKDLT